MDMYEDTTVSMAKCPYRETMGDNPQDNKIGKRPGLKGGQADLYRTLDQAKSIVFSPDTFVRPRSPDHFLPVKSKSSPAPVLSLLVTQHHSKTIRRSPPSKLPIARNCDNPNSEHYPRSAIQRSKTSSTTASTAPSPIAVAPKETTNKPPFVYSLPTIRERLSARSRPPFVRPEEMSQQDGKHTMVTKAKAPVLLTKLRAERHKNNEKSPKTSTDAENRTGTKPSSHQTESPVGHPPSLSYLFSHSPDSDARNNASKRLSLDSIHVNTPDSAYEERFWTPKSSPNWATLESSLHSRPVEHSSPLHHHSRASNIAGNRSRANGQSSHQHDSGAELPDWPLSAVRSDMDRLGIEKPHHHQGHTDIGDESFIECSFITDDEPQVAESVASEFWGSISTIHRRNCSPCDPPMRSHQVSSMSHDTESSSATTVKLIDECRESDVSTSTDKTTPFPEIPASVLHETSLDILRSTIEEALEPKKKQTKAVLSKNPDDSVIIPKRTTLRNDTAVPLQQISPSLVRCSACRAETKHQQSHPGKENTNEKLTKLYSEVIKGTGPPTTPIRGGSKNSTHEAPCSRRSSTASQLEDETANAIDLEPKVARIQKSSEVDAVPQSAKAEDIQASRKSRLRGEATSFVPIWANDSEPINSKVSTWEELARSGRARYGPPPMQLLTPNAPKVGSQNGLQLAMPNLDVDARLHHDAFTGQFQTTNYDINEDANMYNRYPWCTMTPHVWGDDGAFGNDEYKVEVVDPTQVAAINNTSTAPEVSDSSPRRLSINTLKKLEDTHTTRLITAQLADLARTAVDTNHGPGPYPHTMPDATRPITENMWMPPIRTGHRYNGRNILPNPRSREWYELANAIKLLNLEFAQQDSRTQKWWEPEIPTGFEARARFTQPPKPTKVLGEPLRGESRTEFDWVNVTLTGCKYCGNDQHLDTTCPLRGLHANAGNAHCLNCNTSDHMLRECTSWPVFDDTDSRARKLQLYAHTEHWRRTLHQQHSRFAEKAGITKYPELKPGVGDPSMAFSWLDCSPCTPAMHWDSIQDNVQVIKEQCKEYHEDDKTHEYWQDPNWLLEYQNCPVVWNMMHKENPEVSWAVFNPLNSVAVDAFTRTGIRAMGWDAPALPDGKVV